MTTSARTESSNDRYDEGPSSCCHGASNGPVHSGTNITGDCCGGHGQHEPSDHAGHHCRHEEHRQHRDHDADAAR